MLTSLLISSITNAKKLVSSILFARKFSKPASSNISSDAKWAAIDITGAFESCQLSAVGIGEKVSGILNRSSLLCPHHPANLGIFSFDTCLSCMKYPLTPPGPEFKYL